MIPTIWCRMCCMEPDRFEWIPHSFFDSPVVWTCHVWPCPSLFSSSSLLRTICGSTRRMDGPTCSPLRNSMERKAVGSNPDADRRVERFSADRKKKTSLKALDMAPTTAGYAMQEAAEVHQLAFRSQPLQIASPPSLSFSCLLHIYP